MTSLLCSNKLHLPSVKKQLGQRKMHAFHHTPVFHVIWKLLHFCNTINWKQKQYIYLLKRQLIERTYIHTKDAIDLCFGIG